MKASVLENVPLAPFTTLGIGGPARYFIHAGTEKTVLEGVHFALEQGVPLLVLGGGSNLVVADAGFPGVVLRVEIKGRHWSGERLTAGAGEDWDGVAAGVVARNLSGVECLSGIPGSVGGTPVQNVGAYGQEVSGTLAAVRAYDRQTNRIVDLSREDCAFSYRKSIFNTTARDRYIVLDVTYAFSRDAAPCIEYPDLKRELENVSHPTLIQVRDAVRRLRARKAMLIQEGDPDCRSAGSFFKNPIFSPEAFARLESLAGEPLPRFPAPAGEVKTSAAWLIEHSGIAKGYRHGRAGVSTKHTLALVNTGGATAEELMALAREIRERVEDRYGVRLDIEPVLVA